MATAILHTEHKDWNSFRLKSLLKKLKNKKILVIGDVGVDRYTLGSVERISPEAPVPIVLVGEEKLKLGLAANVADNVQALGGIPLLIGVMGRDRCADDFRDLLKKLGISTTHLLIDSSRRTILKERVVSELQQLLRIDYESQHPMGNKTQTKVLRKIEKLMPSVDAVIMEDYAKGLLTPFLAKAIIDLANARGKIVAVDPNIKSTVSLYAGATMITPNTKEAEKLSGIIIRDQASLLEAGRKLLTLTKCEYVIVTRGKEGIAVFCRQPDSVHLIPTYAREVYDVSGAGDTVISLMTMAVCAGASIEEAAILGNLAGGIEVGKRGTATVSPGEIAEAMEHFQKKHILDQKSTG